MRKRINLSVPADTMGELEAVVEAYGFASVCQLVLALLRLFLRFRHGRLPDGLPEDLGEEISAMFDALGSRVPQPSDTVPPKNLRR